MNKMEYNDHKDGKPKLKYLDDIVKLNNLTNTIGCIGYIISTTWSSINNFINLVISCYSIYKQHITDIYINTASENQQEVIIKFCTRIYPYIEIISQKFSIIHYKTIYKISELNKSINELTNPNSTVLIQSITHLIDTLKSNSMYIHIHILGSINQELNNICKCISSNNIYLIDPIYLNKLNINIINSMIQLNCMIYS